MEISITKVGDSIACYKSFKDIEGRGEISYFLTELEIIKNELLVKWQNYDEEELQNGI
jgi:hypothetical protein